MNKRGRFRIVASEGQPESLTSAEALAIIREIAADSARVHVLRHGKDRRRQRSVSHEDIWRVLRRGSVTEGPYVALKSGYWRVNVTGRTAGEELTCVAEIEWRERILVVTVFRT